MEDDKITVDRRTYEATEDLAKKHTAFVALFSFASFFIGGMIGHYMGNNKEALEIMEERMVSRIDDISENNEVINGKIDYILEDRDKTLSDILNRLNEMKTPTKFTFEVDKEGRLVLKK